MHAHENSTACANYKLSIVDVRQFQFRAFPRESGRDNERRQFNSPKFEFKIIKTLPKWASLGISKHARLCFVSSAEKVAKEWSGPFSPITQKV